MEPLRFTEGGRAGELACMPGFEATRHFFTSTSTSTTPICPLDERASTPAIRGCHRSLGSYPINNSSGPLELESKVRFTKYEVEATHLQIQLTDVKLTCILLSTYVYEQVIYIYTYIAVGESARRDTCWLALQGGIKYRQLRRGVQQYLKTIHTSRHFPCIGIHTHYVFKVGLVDSVWLGC